MREVWMCSARWRVVLEPREFLFGYYGAPGTPRFKIMVRHKEWKYIFMANGGREQLFNLNEDPKELRNAIGSHADIAKQLRAKAASACNRPGGASRRRRAAPTTRTLRPARVLMGGSQPLDELAGQDLADLVAGQRVDRLEAGRHLVRRQVLAAQRVERAVGVRRRRRSRDDERPRHLAEPVVGRRRRRRRRRPSGARRSTSSTSPGYTFSPPRLIMSRHPALDPHEALVVDAADVAGAEPAVGGEPVGEVAAVGVAAAQRRGRTHSSPGSSAGRAVVVDDRIDTPSWGRPDRPSLSSPCSRESAAFQPTISPPISVWP